MEHDSKFKKTAHLFAHRKAGAQHRFHREYVELAAKVKASWTADLMRMETEAKDVFKWNQALSATKMERNKGLLQEDVKSLMRSVFTRFKEEINRIVVELNGHPQEDGNVVFPDGSIAKMPKGLFIEPEHLVRFE